MNSRFTYKASQLSDEELKIRIENRQKYLPETTEATLAELKQRGHGFSEEELDVINKDIKAQRNNAAMAGSGSSGLFNDQYKNNLVEDTEAPMLYSRRALYVFTFFFSPLFGSIMMAINCAKINNRSGIVWVLLFGVFFTTAQIIGLNYVHGGSGYGYICGFIAAACIHSFFWNRLIGKSTFYRAKPIWVPLIIGLLLCGLILWAMFYGTNQ